MDSGGDLPAAHQPQEKKPRSRFLVFRDRLLSPHLKEYCPQAAEDQHRQQVVVADDVVRVSTNPPLSPAQNAPSIHGTPEGSSCCQLSLGGGRRSSEAAPAAAATGGAGRRTPPEPLPPHGRSSVEGRLAMVGDGSEGPLRRGSSAGGATAGSGRQAGGAGRGAAPGGSDVTKSGRGLPVPKTALSGSAADGAGGVLRRTSSARAASSSAGARRTVTLTEPQPPTRASIDGVSSADDVIVATSTGDDYGHITWSPTPVVARPDATAVSPKAEPQTQRSPTSGFLTRIARKTESKRSSKATTAAAAAVDVNSQVTSVGSAAPVGTRQDFPFIFNLLRSQPAAGAVNVHALNRIREGVAAAPGGNSDEAVSSSDVTEDVPSHGDAGQLPPEMKQRQPENVRPQRRLLPVPSVDTVLSTSGHVTSVDGTNPHLPSHLYRSTTVVVRPELCTAVVAADVHQSATGECDSRDVTSVGSDRLPPIAADSFRRNDKLRSSLPVVGATNRSLERPLGIVFLVFRNDTKPGLLPNEITSISTVWALFVRAFPNKLSMPWFETAKWTIWYLDSKAGVYRILQDLRAISDRSILRLEETETCLGVDTVHSLPRYGLHSPVDAAAAAVGRLPHGRPIRGSASPLAVRRPIRSPLGVGAAAKAASSEEALACHPCGHRLQLTAGKDSAPGSPNAPHHLSRDRLSEMETRMNSLAALVRCAILRPDMTTGSVDSLTSDTSQVTVQKSPFSPTSTGSLEDDAETRQQRLRAILDQAHCLQAETQLLRRAHIEHVATMTELLRETYAKLMSVMTSLTAAAPRTHRQQIVRDQGGYCVDAARIEGQLKNLEACVEELRNDVVSGKCRVILGDVEAMVLALGHIGRSLAALKGRLNHLQERMKPVMASEIEVVVQEERFIKEEPHRLEKSVTRCKQLTGTLSTLKKLAMVQDSNVSLTGTSQPADKSFVKQKTETTSQKPEELQNMQSTSSAASSSVGHMATKGQITSAMNVDQRTVSNRSQPATAVNPTASTSKLIGGGILKKTSSPTVGALPITKGRLQQQQQQQQAAQSEPVSSTSSSSTSSSMVQQQQGQSPPPIPPPRKFVLQTIQTSAATTSSTSSTTSPDVWQRHDTRSLGSAARRRAVQAAATAAGVRPSSAPKSCPSSPSFDYSPRQLRAAAGTGPEGSTSGRHHQAIGADLMMRCPSKFVSGPCSSTPAVVCHAPPPSSSPSNGSERSAGVVGSPRRTRLPTSLAGHIHQDIT